MARASLPIRFTLVTAHAPCASARLGLASYTKNLPARSVLSSKSCQHYDGGNFAPGHQAWLRRSLTTE